MQIVDNSYVQKDEIGIKKDGRANTVTKTIEAARRNMGISVAGLARRVNMDNKRLWYVLNGQREMRVDEFLKLCIALKLDPRSFVTRGMVEEVAEATRRSIGCSDDLDI